MDVENLIRDFATPYRVTKGEKFRLAHVDPGDTRGLESDDKPQAQAALQRGVRALAESQEKLYAQDRWAVLIILQGMDTAGKDGAVKHVMSGVNPQGCQVYSFKAPSGEELDHDFLWRYVTRLPERGRIGIFNRSYYEETLVVRVHPELLARQKLPPGLVGKGIWAQRFKDIRRFERYLARNGVLVRKIFLHLSRKEQKKRLLQRLEDPEKNWKFSPDDLTARDRWPDYMTAYEDMIRSTATEYAPWYVVPADNKWFTRLVVAAASVDALWSLDLRFPEVSGAQRRALAAFRQKLSRAR